MSKIFEALRKTEGALGEVAKAFLAQDLPVPAAAEATEQSAHASLLPDANSTEPAASKSEVQARTIELPQDSPMLPFDGSDNQAAEQYRIIRTKIQHHRAQPKTILVSSPMPGDGKTISAVNLAAALSLQEGLRVLLLDCDFRRSSLCKLLGLDATPGLGEVIRNEAPLESSLVRIAQFPNLYVLPPGVVLPSAAELLSTARWQSLIEMFRADFRFVVIDAPPIGSVAEYDLLQLASDGVVLIVRQDHTNRQLWERGLETVPKAKQLGVILNCAEDWFLWKTHSYYYYGKTQ